MATTAEAVIIGGGVMGCSILYHLATRGLDDALLLERDILGSGSTGRSSSAIGMYLSTGVLSRMAWQSLEIFRDFSDRVGGECGYNQTGHLVFAGDTEEAAFRSNIAMQQQVGIRTGIIDRQQAREIAPHFYLDDCAAIAYEPRSGHADASATAYAYATRARQLGSRVRLQAPAIGVEVQSERVVAVSAADERIETPLAVVATGPWSRNFLLRHGIDLPLAATRHEVLHLKRPLEQLPHHPGGTDIANRTYFRPESADLTLVGDEAPGEVVHDPEIYGRRASQGFIGEVWRRLARRIPAMAEARFGAGYAGLYTSTPDAHPIMDRVEGIQGLYVCTGFSGHGFKLSPMVGQLMAELVLDSQTTSIDITPLRMSRFPEGRGTRPNYGFRGLV